MLSSMENEGRGPTPAEAAAALGDVAASRTALSHELTPGLGFFAALGALIAASIAVAGVGLADQDLLVAGAGATIFAVGAAAQLWLVRRATGIWVTGFASRVVLGTGALASGSYVVALLVAVWAATAEHWWLMTLVAAAGGVAYTHGGRRWLRRYHGQPERHIGAESAVVLAAVSALAVAGLVVLVLAG